MQSRIQPCCSGTYQPSSLSSRVIRVRWTRPLGAQRNQNMFGEHRFSSSADHLMWVNRPLSLWPLIWDGTTVPQTNSHPGRPWQAKPKKVPNHVADHYLLLSADELLTDVLRHYRENVWPLIEDIALNRCVSWQIGTGGFYFMPDLVNRTLKTLLPSHRQ